MSIHLSSDAHAHAHALAPLGTRSACRGKEVEEQEADAPVLEGPEIVSLEEAEEGTSEAASRTWTLPIMSDCSRTWRNCLGSGKKPLKRKDLGAWKTHP
jgi:hypothetical protein